MDTINYYMLYYQRAAASAWYNMTPAQYGYVLIGIAIFGYILMKSGNKSPGQ